jgi:hypothetical protein
MEQQLENGRLGQEAGIAIGPILFIIAILGILAAAIAAGSGGFTASTTSESAKTQASALIQIGENLKIGMDRIVMEGGLAPTGTASNSVVAFNTSDSTNSNSLFSPAGGGISGPSNTMGTPGAIWHFVYGPINGIGTGTVANSDVLAVLQVSPTVCAEINNRAVGVPYAPATAVELGNFDASTATSITQMTTGEGLTNWGAMLLNGTTHLNGVSTGCVYNSTTATANTSGYYYYEVLAVQ